MPNPNTPYLQAGIGGRSNMNATMDGQEITSISDFSPNAGTVVCVNSPILTLTNRGGTDYKGFGTTYDFKGFKIAGDGPITTNGKNSAIVLIVTHDGFDMNGFYIFNAQQANNPNTVAAFGNVMSGCENFLGSRGTLPTTGPVALATRRIVVSNGAEISGVLVAGYARHTLWYYTTDPITRYFLNQGDQVGSYDWNWQQNGNTQLHDSQVFVWARTDPDLTNQQIVNEMDYSLSLYGGSASASVGEALNDQVRIFYAGDSRLDGRSGSSGMGIWFNQCADAVDTFFGFQARHYNGGVYGSQSGEGFRRVANIVGSLSDGIASQLATGQGAVNVLVIAPFGVNGLHSEPGSAASQWANTVSLGQAFLAGCVAAGVQGRVVVCTEAGCTTSYASLSDMQAYSALVVAHYADIDTNTALVRIDTDPIMGPTADTWSTGPNTYTDDELHWGTPAATIVAGLVAPPLIAQVQAILASYSTEDTRRLYNLRSIAPFKTGPNRKKKGADDEEDADSEVQQQSLTTPRRAVARVSYPARGK